MVVIIILVGIFKEQILQSWWLNFDNSLQTVAFELRPHCRIKIRYRYSIPKSMKKKICQSSI